MVAWLGLQWRPGDGASVPLLVVALALGTATFGSLGLLLAGTLRADATLALANGLFILAIAIGGVVIPTRDLPGRLASLADVLPAAALSDAVRMALGAGPAGAAPFAVLGAWAVAAGATASRAFRWD